MRILASDVLADATLTSTNESTNYPASNLVHQFLRVRWQPTATGENTVTATWSTAQTMNCVFLGYISSLITQVDISVYNSGGLVETLSDVDISLGSGAYYFADTYDDIISMEIVETGTLGAYIGGAACGAYYQAPYFDSAHPFGVTNTSIVSSTPWGQVQAYKVPPRESANFTWTALTFAQYRAFRDAVITPVGVGGTLWVDYYESDHASKAPGYAALAEAAGSTNQGLSYSWSVKFEEAR